MSDLGNRIEDHPPSNDRDEGRKRKRLQPGYFGLIKDGLDLSRDDHDKDYGSDLQNTYAPVSPLESPIPHALSPASELPSSPTPTTVTLEDTTESEKV
jgi:hypothetical protein